MSNTQSALCTLYSKTRLIRVSDGATIGTGQFLGGVGANGIALGFAVTDTFKGLNPAQSYIAQLIASKNSSVGPIAVNDTWVRAEHE